jgi:hypothetical protein
MLKCKVLRLQIAGAAALAMLFASSAFAESRHLQGTRSFSSPSRSYGSRSFTPSRSFGGSRSFTPSRSFGGSRSFTPSRFGGSRSFTPSRFGGSRSFTPSRFGGSRSFAPSRSFRGSRSFTPSHASGSRWFGSRGSARPSAPPRSFGSRGVAPSYRGGYHGYRGGTYGGHYGNGPFRGYNSGQRFFGRGRIERIAPYHGGYHVWLGGWGYPFYVPYRFWDPFRFRLGLFIGFNAFYDPLGYYSVYDPWYYPYPPATVVVAPPPVYNDGGYRDSDVSVVHGTVTAVDFARDTMWVDDDVTHKNVTVLMPPDRNLNSVRTGDYVEVSGDWQSDGVFDAHALDRFDPRGR